MTDPAHWDGTANAWRTPRHVHFRQEAADAQADSTPRPFSRSRKTPISAIHNQSLLFRAAHLHCGTPVQKQSSLSFPAQARSDAAHRTLSATASDNTQQEQYSSFINFDANIGKRNASAKLLATKPGHKQNPVSFYAFLKL